MSRKSFIVDYGVRSKLVQYLHLQKEHRFFCDLKVNVGSVASVHLHSCVLAAFSPCLESLVMSIRKNEKLPQGFGKEDLQWSFKHPLEITLCSEDNDTSKLECEQCALRFFDFLYTGKIKIEIDHIHHVEYLCNLLQVKDLLEACNVCRKKFEPFKNLIHNNVALTDLKARKRQDKLQDNSDDFREEVQSQVSTRHSTHPLGTLMTCEQNKLKTNETEDVLKCKRNSKSFPVFPRLLKRKVKEKNPSGSWLSNQVPLYQSTGQKTTPDNSIQSGRFSERANEQTIASVKNKEVLCREEFIDKVEENFPSKEKQAYTLSGEFSNKMSFSHILLSNKSEPINKTNEIKMHSIIQDAENHLIKPVTSNNILTLYDTSLIQRKETCDSPEDLEKEEPMKSNEYKSFPREKEESPLENKEVLVNKEKAGPQCICCDYFAKNHYDLLTHMLLSNHKKKICSLCLVDTKSWKTLSEHILEHNDPLPFFCRYCSMRFETFSALNQHISKHTGMVPCYCPICFVLFNSKLDLQNHMVEHTEGEIYVCRQCYFSTTDINEFNSHSSVLTDCDFECLQPNCSFKTDLVCILKDHSVHHSYIGELSRSSCSNEDFEKHIMENEDNVQVFKHPDSKCSFKTNLESSSVVKQFSFLCNVCGNTYSKLQDLHQHVLQHSSCEPSISCPICPFQGNTCVHVIQHLMKCHPQYKCEIVKVMDASDIQNSLISVLNESNILMTSEKQIESVSNSTKVEEYDLASVGMDT